MTETENAILSDSKNAQKNQANPANEQEYTITFHRLGGCI